MTNIPELSSRSGEHKASPGILLSIVIPHHNRGEDLRALLRTIPDLPEIEVVMVDDNSTKEVSVPDPAQLCLRRYRLAPDKRYAGAARNLGLENSNGTFVFFADSDDEFDTRALAGCLDYLRHCKQDCIYTPVTSRLDGTTRTGDRHKRYNTLLDRFRATGDDLLLTNYFPPWGRFIRTAHLRRHKVHFDEIVASNDVMFSLRLALSRGRTTILDNTVYIVRQGNVSLSNTYSQEVVEARTQTLIRFNTRLKQEGLHQYRIVASGYLLRLFRADKRVFLSQLITFIRAGQPVLPRSRLQLIKVLSILGTGR